MPGVNFNGGDSDVLYSSEDHPRVDDLFRVQKRGMIIFGQIPFKLKVLPRPLAYFVSRLYSFFIFCMTFHLMVLFIKTTLDKFENHTSLEEVTDALTMVVIYSFSGFATYYWLWRSERLEIFMERINRHYGHHSMAGLTFVSSYRSYSIARNVAIAWVSSCCGAVLLWSGAPLLMEQRTLPLNCWYPFDPLQPGVYTPVYIIQLLAQIDVGNSFGNISALFASLGIILLGQFDMLYCSLKNLDSHARLLSGVDLAVLRNLQKQLTMGHDDELNQYVFSQEYKTNLMVFRSIRPAAQTLKAALHESLVECVHLHQFLLNSCEEMEQLFNPYCLCKSLQITIQLCLLVFAAAEGQTSLLRTINLLQYFGLTVVELMLFTYVGELLRSHSVRAGEAYWRTPWWQTASMIRTDVLIFLANSKRAVQLTAGKFYYMDVERLRLVLTQAFSLMTLLQKLSKKK